MVLEDVDSQLDVARAVTPMSEIRRHKGVPLEEFDRQYPDWEWSEQRQRNRLMWDDEGRAWVPMVEPVHGLPYAYDEPGFTPKAEEALIRLSDKVMEDIRAGKGVIFDPDEPDD